MISFDPETDYIVPFKNLFYRSLADASHMPNNSVYHKEYQNRTMEYKLNNFGYRGKTDIDGTEELLVLGCSQTYGTGVLLEHTWGNIFAESINKKYALLAQEGDSIQAQVYKAFRYCEEFKNPKVIVGVFPLMRLEFPYIPKKLGKNFQSDTRHGPQDPCIKQSFAQKGEPMPIAKIPYSLDEIMPREFYVFYNFMFIQMLEQYCKSNNIIFIWNCYEDQSFIDYVKENVPIVLNNYLEIDNGKVFPFFRQETDYAPVSNNKCEDECFYLPRYNKDYEYADMYYRAADASGLNNGHWGLHSHKHIAEAFYLEYKKRINEIE